MEGDYCHEYNERGDRNEANGLVPKGVNISSKRSVGVYLTLDSYRSYCVTQLLLRTNECVSEWPTQNREPTQRSQLGVNAHRN